MTRPFLSAIQPFVLIHYMFYSIFILKNTKKFGEKQNNY